jgi:hypothetical protein
MGIKPAIVYNNRALDGRQPFADAFLHFLSPFVRFYFKASSRIQPHIYLTLLIIFTLVIQTAHNGTLLVTTGQG